MRIKFLMILFVLMFCPISWADEIDNMLIRIEEQDYEGVHPDLARQWKRDEYNKAKIFILNEIRKELKQKNDYCGTYIQKENGNYYCDGCGLPAPKNWHMRKGR